MLGKRREGISLKLGTLFDIAPDQEIQSLISAETIRQRISKGLMHLGHSRYLEKLKKEDKKKDKLRSAIINSTTSSDGVPDAPRADCSVVNGLSGSCKRLTKGATHGTKPLGLGQKRHFSLIRDKEYPGFCLSLAYPGFHFRRTLQQHSHHVISSGGFSSIHRIDILSSNRTVYPRSAPQLAKRIVPRYTKKARVCTSRSPIRLLGVLSLVASSGCLVGLHALGC